MGLRTGTRTVAQQARIDAHVEKAIATAPPLTAEMREDIARILRPRPTDFVSEPHRIELAR